MSTGIFSIGVSGLLAAQQALLTTEHNVTNANTPGYNRQRTLQATNVAIMTGAGAMGQGVHVTTVERQYDQFLVGQVNYAQTNTSELETYYSQIKQVDDMLADPNAGLSPALQSFFTGVQQVAANPANLPARQAMVSTAQTLVERFHGLQDRINLVWEQVNGEIQDSVSAINTYSAQIAELNQRIVIAQGSFGQPPNDLLDQRDNLVAELNKLVRVQTSTNTDGSYNVFVGTGQQLVVGTQVTTMTARASSEDPTKIVIGLLTAGSSQELPESLITGGKLGGLLTFRSGALVPAANQLGRVVASLALTFNDQHALGQDLLGNVAGSGLISNFFTVPAPRVVNNTNNTGAGSVSAALVDPAADSRFTLSFAAGTYTVTRASDGQSWSGASLAALQTTVNSATGNALVLPNITAGSVQVTDGKLFTRLAASDYKVTFGAAGAYSIIRQSDNVTVAAGSGAGTVTVDGVQITIGAVGNNGDTFLIQPTHDMAGNFTVDSRFAADPRLIAAAAPVRTQPTLTNTGNMVLSQGAVSTGYSRASLPVTITVNTGAGTLSGFPVGTPVTVFYSDGTSAVVSAGSVNLANGGSPIAKVTFDGMTFTLAGTPGNGDSYTIRTNPNGVSDGRNGVLLGMLQTANTLAGGTASYQGAYAQLVADTGIRTREAKVKGDAQQALLDQSQAAREALSGVNLDEEAANLIKFQQAYQASAKMLEVGSKLFDSILALG